MLLVVTKSQIKNACLTTFMPLFSMESCSTVHAMNGKIN